MVWKDFYDDRFLVVVKNNNKNFISTDLGFILVKKGLREFLCLTGQITKIDELIFWPMQILGVV